MSRRSLTLLIAAVGTGGMAEVFLAVSQGPMGFSKLVVVKRLRVGMADDPVVVDMFLDEARLAARLNHPNVVHTYEIGEADGALFIAIGHDPNTKLFVDQLDHDENGYLVTTPGTTETNIPGVFAAGDVRNTDLRQIVMACADGARAATYASEFMREIARNR